MTDLADLPFINYNTGSTSTMAAVLHYTNPELQQRIAKFHDNSEIDLSGGKYTDNDMEIVVEQAMIDKKCTQLILHHNHITQEGASKLAEALRNNTSLVKLNLGDNGIGDVGAEYIAKALSESNNTLTKLHLQSNGITEKGAEHLSRMLTNNRVICRLGLDYNKIGDRGVEFLSLALCSDSIEVNQASRCKGRENMSTNNGSPLTALFLDGNNITDVGVTYLAKMLEVNQTLTGLALGRNDISDMGAGKLIKTLTNYETGLIKLNLFSNKQITDRSVDNFVTLFRRDHRLKLFKLYDCSFSEWGQDKLQEAARCIHGFKLLLEGDGFDYNRSYQKPHKPRHSGIERRYGSNCHQSYQKPYKPTHSGFEEWGSSRREGYTSKKTNIKEPTGSHSSGDKCPGVVESKVSSATSISEATVQLPTLYTADIRSDDVVSKCATNMGLLTISVDSPSTAALPNTTPNVPAVKKSANVNNGTGIGVD